MKEKEIVLKEQWYTAEHIDRESGHYIKTKYRKVEEYAFYLRFIGNWFHPCKKCQGHLKKLLQTVELHISTDKATIHFLQRINEDENELYYEFGLPFVQSVWLYTWKPCKDCQNNLRKLMQTASSLIIGNDKYEHPVEFNMKNATSSDDDSYVTLDEHPATEEEKKRIGDNWLYEEVEVEP